MQLRRARRRRSKALSIAAVCLLGVLAAPPPAMAKFSGAAAGSGRAQAVDVAVPTGPTATFAGLSGIGGILCTIHAVWTPAPPAGRQYTLYRVIGGSPTVLQSGITTASSYDDTFPLAILAGNPSYFLRSTLTGTTWIRDSTATASHC